LTAESLGEGEVASIGEGSLDESIWDPEVLESIGEARVRHVNLESFERVFDREIEVEPHVVEPFERLAGPDLGLIEGTDDVSLMNELGDEMLAFPTSDGREFGEDRIREEVETSSNDVESVVEGRSCFESLVDDSGPDALNGEDDELSGEFSDPGEEEFRRESVRSGVEGLEFLDGLGKEDGEGESHLRLDFGEPVVDLGELHERDGVGERNLLSFPRHHSLDLSEFLVEHDRRDPSEHLLEVLHDPNDVLGVSDDLEEVLVSDEVEPREGRSLPFEVLSESLLDLGEEVGQSFKTLLDSLDVEDVEDEGRLVDLLHDGEELGVDVGESSALDGKKMLDVGASREDSLEVDPLSLDVDPDV